MGGEEGGDEGAGEEISREKRKGDGGWGERDAAEGGRGDALRVAGEVESVLG